MVLDKIKKLTLIQRFRSLLLGKEKPNLFTRVSLVSAFFIWLYLFSWQLITSASILLLGNLDQSPIVRAAYGHIGHSKYGYTDTINRLFLHSLSQLTLYVILLAGLVLIWRRKKWGFLIYVFGNILSLFISFILMGWAFLQNEIPLIDYILIASTTIYFTIGLFIFHRKSDTSTVES